MDWIRRTTHLAAPLALLAITLRVLLPAFHTHAPHAHVGDAHAETTHACAHDAGPLPAIGADADRPLQQAEAEDCLACELEMRTPFGSTTAPVDPGITTDRGESAGIGHGRWGGSSAVALPRPRAPPGDDD
ncbi:MAG: hypothetical protein AAF628_14855 [Planctomycetota bacterium]